MPVKFFSRYNDHSISFRDGNTSVLLVYHSSENFSSPFVSGYFFSGQKYRDLSFLLTSEQFPNDRIVEFYNAVLKFKRAKRLNISRLTQLTKKLLSGKKDISRKL